MKAKIGGESTFPLFLGVPVGATISGIGTVWDVGVNGIGHVLSNLDQESPFEYRAYTLAAIPTQKNRVDTSDEPGEQTLETWWARAQHTWHQGAGQEVFDSPVSSRYAFYKSFRLDPWTPGIIKLLKDTFQFDSGAFNDYLLLADGNRLYYGEDGSIIQIDDLDSPTPVTKSPALGNIQAMVSDGSNLYVAFAPGGSNGIHEIDIPNFGADSFSKMNNLSPHVMGLVKDRLICGVGNALHEITDFTSLTDGATPFFTHKSEDWIWTAMTETSAAIFVSGYAGDRSAIYSITFDTSDVAAGLTIGAPHLVWQAPEGETIYSVRGYLGKALMVGTSSGVRNAFVVSTEGDLDVSGLIAETEEPVRDFTFQGEYAWFTWSNWDSTYSGVGRIDLGTLAYASDLMYAIQGTVNSVVDFQGRIVFSVVNVSGGADSEIVAEEASNLAPSGWFRTGEIRYGTFEDKALRFFDALTIGSGGTLDLDIAIEQGNFTSVITDAAVGEIIESLSGSSGTRMELRVTLDRDSGDATLGPTLLEWRLRAEPLAVGRFRYFVPVMLYDRMTTLDGRSFGYIGYGREKLTELETLYRNGTVFKFQGPDTGRPHGADPVDVKLEDLQFKSFTPTHKGFDGLGGIALLVMREQG